MVQFDYCTEPLLLTNPIKAGTNSLSNRVCVCVTLANRCAMQCRFKSIISLKCAQLNMFYTHSDIRHLQSHNLMWISYRLQKRRQCEYRPFIAVRNLIIFIHISFKWATFYVHFYALFFIPSLKIHEEI